MAKHIQFRRDTAARWASFNPIPVQGELCLELDTMQFKIGDGVTAWNSLPYGGLVGPAGQINYIFDDFTLNPSQVLAKQITLSNTPANPVKVELCLQGAPTQVANIDYVVSGNVLSWASLALEELVDVGSVLFVKYTI